jgi:hypothetical protein
MDSWLKNCLFLVGKSTANGLKCNDLTPQKLHAIHQQTPLLLVRGFLWFAAGTAYSLTRLL